MSNQAILKWLEGLCEQSDEARRRGDFTVLTQIGMTPALKYFHDQVYKLGLSATVFEHSPYWRQAETLYNEYMTEQTQAATVAEHSEQISALEAKIDQLIGLVTPLVESDEPEPEADEPAPRKKRKAKAGAEPEAAPAAEPDAEGDDDETEPETED